MASRKARGGCCSSAVKNFLQKENGLATINHPTYSCDKCGKVFEKRIKVRHSWPKILPYAQDRANYCEVRFTLDIWHGVSTADPDLCPDCIRENLLGALEDTVRAFAEDMFDQ